MRIKSEENALRLNGVIRNLSGVKSREAGLAGTIDRDIYRSVLRYMSSSVIPQYVSVSFHTGFRVLRTILVFSLLAWKIKSREELSCHIRTALQKVTLNVCQSAAPQVRHCSAGTIINPTLNAENKRVKGNRGIKPWVTIKPDLAGSRQQVQFDVGVG